MEELFDDRSTLRTRAQALLYDGNRCVACCVRQLAAPTRRVWCCQMRVLCPLRQSFGVVPSRIRGAPGSSRPLRVGTSAAEAEPLFELDVVTYKRPLLAGEACARVGVAAVVKVRCSLRQCGSAAVLCEPSEALR